MQTQVVYKSAAELGIEEWELLGLIKLIGPLSRGEINFNMMVPMCGTVGCIGGHLANGIGMSAKDYVNSYQPHLYLTSDNALGRLYWPDVGHKAWRATPMQGAEAIVNLLVTGEANWDAVMAD